MVMRVMQFFFCMASEPACLPGPKAWHIDRPPVLAPINHLAMSFVTEPWSCTYSSLGHWDEVESPWHSGHRLSRVAPHCSPRPQRRWRPQKWSPVWYTATQYG